MLIRIGTSSKYYFLRFDSVSIFLLSECCDAMIMVEIIDIQLCFFCIHIAFGSTPSKRIRVVIEVIFIRVVIVNLPQTLIHATIPRVILPNIRAISVKFVSVDHKYSIALGIFFNPPIHA